MWITLHGHQTLKSKLFNIQEETNSMNKPIPEQKSAKNISLYLKFHTLNNIRIQLKHTSQIAKIQNHKNHSYSSHITITTQTNIHIYKKVKIFIEKKGLCQEREREEIMGTYARARKLSRISPWICSNWGPMGKSVAIRNLGQIDLTSKP